MVQLLSLNEGFPVTPARSNAVASSRAAKIASGPKHCCGPATHSPAPGDDVARSCRGAERGPEVAKTGHVGRWDAEPVIFVDRLGGLHKYSAYDKIR